MPIAPKYIIVFSVWASLGLAGRSQTTSSTVSQKKVTSQQFDTAGPFTIGNNLTPEQKAQTAARVKQFIWDHWIDRRRGKVNVIAFTMEGNRSSTTFSIEPDDAGRWYIRVESEFDIVVLVPKAKHQTRVEAFTQLERIDIKTQAVVPKSEQRAATTYALRFINKRRNSAWTY